MFSVLNEVMFCVCMVLLLILLSDMPLYIAIFLLIRFSSILRCLHATAFGNKLVTIFPTVFALIHSFELPVCLVANALYSLSISPRGTSPSLSDCRFLANLQLIQCFFHTYRYINNFLISTKCLILKDAQSCEFYSQDIQSTVFFMLH